MTNASSSGRSTAFVDAIVIIVYIVTIALACILFSRGGLEGLIGLGIGGVVGFFRPTAEKKIGRQVFEGSFAGLWGGLILGGLFHSALTQFAANLF